MRIRQWRALALTSAAIAATVLFAACSNSTVTVVTPTNTPASVTCASVLPGGTAPTITNVLLPSGTVMTAPATTGGGAGQFTVNTYQGCAPNNTTALDITGGHGTLAFVAAQQFAGWQTSNSFPFDGQRQSTCNAQSCLANSTTATMPSYLALDQVANRGGGTITFRLRVASPPPAPSCGSGFSSGYYYKIPAPNFSQTTLYNDLPLPPLTQIEPNDSAGHVGYSLCSAGTTTSIASFLQAELPPLGWSQTDASDWANGSYTLNIQVNSATGWLLDFPNLNAVG